MIRGKGYRPDPAGHQRTPLRAIAHRLGAVPASATLEAYAPRVMDQGQTGSCTGHATACAISTALAAAGTPLPFMPSPAGIYTLGRVLGRTSPVLPLTDDGAEPNQVMRGISGFGVRAMGPLASDGRYSDAEFATINDEPTLLELEADARAILLGEYSVSTPEDVALALANKIPVTVAVEADTDAFQNYSGGVLEPMGTALDHYVTLIGYTTTTAGLVFTLRNSWSEDWGIRGDAFVSEEAVRQFGDMVAMKVRLA